MSAIVINIDTSLTNVPTIEVGKQGENGATQVVFDVSEMVETYGSGTAYVVVQRRGDAEPYLLDNTSQSGDKVTWTVSNVDTDVYGTGRVQLFWMINEQVAKTVTYQFYVEEALHDPQDAPVVPGGWISDEIGNLDNLTTTAKANLVAAINEVNSKATTNTTAIGTLANLTTTEKSNLVGAINEVDADVSDVKEDLEAETTARESADTKMATDITTLYDMGTPSSYNNDKVPYLFRPSGGGKYIGGIEKDTIVGGTVAWNQLVNAYTPRTEQNKGLTITYTTNTISITGTATERGNFSIMNISKNAGTLLSNHVYYMRACPSGGSGSTYFGGIAGLNIDIGSGGIYKHSNAWDNSSLRFDFYPDIIFNNATFYPQYIDLTQLFGSTIADYIYSLEQANAGAGVAWFKKLFPKDYYEYNAGELISISGLQSHDIVGFNQWDEEWELGEYNITTGEKQNSVSNIRCKNYIPVLPNTKYYNNAPTHWIIFYNADKQKIRSGTADTNHFFTTPSDCAYITFYMNGSYGTTYNHDICINLSWDGERDGEYEPYIKHSYPLDSDLTLRGIPKLDSSNQLYYDGDIYKADGSVTRKYGSRAYQSGDESLTDAITDGTNTVYKLSTPTTETADPYQIPQIVDKDGTEEYVTTGIVPVGHDTDYYLDADSVLTPPSTAGTYSLKVTVASDGSKNYSWVSD